MRRVYKPDITSAVADGFAERQAERERKRAKRAACLRAWIARQPYRKYLNGGERRKIK